MSLILDAINRSQRERAAPGEVPGVATVHYAEATVAPRAWRQGLLGLLLVIAVAVIAWLLLRPVPDVTPQPRAVPTPTAEPAPQPSVAPSPRVEAPAPQVEDPAPAVAPEVAALYEGETSRNEPAPEPQAAPAKEPVETAPPAETAAGAEKVPPDTVSEQAGSEKRETQEQAVDVEALLRAAQREMASEALSEHPAPFLSTLSQQRKDAIPTLLYSAHDYRGDGNSTVLINGKTARAGQGLGKGVSVVEILPDSVVLAFDGKQFRLRALNSWVNL